MERAGQITQEPPLYKEACDVMRIVVKLYQVQFLITFGGHGKYELPDGDGMWRVKVMGKQFVDYDFVKAVQQAVAFVHFAHENQPKKDNNGTGTREGQSGDPPRL